MTKDSSSPEVSVLFVCMGNICRSPSAWGVFRHYVREQGLENCIQIDSAGTHGYHVGGPADPRSHQAALGRGYDLSEHRARQVKKDDFEAYDYILAMDQANFKGLMDICPPHQSHKVKLFLEYAPGVSHREVPDPYYGGGSGFELVLDLIEAASEGLLKEIQEKYSLKSPAK